MALKVQPRHCTPVGERGRRSLHIIPGTVARPIFRIESFFRGRNALNSGGSREVVECYRRNSTETRRVLVESRADREIPYPSSRGGQQRLPTDPQTCDPPSSLTSKRFSVHSVSSSTSSPSSSSFRSSGRRGKITAVPEARRAGEREASRRKVRVIEAASRRRQCRRLASRTQQRTAR